VNDIIIRKRCPDRQTHRQTEMHREKDILTEIIEAEA